MAVRVLLHNYFHVLLVVLLLSFLLLLLLHSSKQSEVIQRTHIFKAEVTDTHLPRPVLLLQVWKRDAFVGASVAEHLTAVATVMTPATEEFENFAALRVRTGVGVLV